MNCNVGNFPSGSPRPFWNSTVSKVSSGLWIPTEKMFTDNGISYHTPWFSHTHLENTAWKMDGVVFSGNKVCVDSKEIIRTRRIRIYPTKEQASVMMHWINSLREIYNFILLDILVPKLRKPVWQGLVTEMTGQWPEHLQDIPYDMRAVAIKEACAAYKKTWDDYMKLPTRGRPIKFHPRCKTNAGSFEVRASAISHRGFYPRKLGGSMRYAEPLPQNICDSRVVFEHEQWHLCVPYKTVSSTSIGCPLNVVAIDPGVRTFMTYFSHNCSGKIGEDTFEKLLKLLKHCDKLKSKHSRERSIRRKRSLWKALQKARFKVKNVVNELHYKVTGWLVGKFDVILYPDFRTSELFGKKRKPRGVRARALRALKFYRFKERLLDKAEKEGKTVLLVTEAYTSKTCTETGKIHQVGSAKILQTVNGEVDRDVAGARNIYLRALVDRPEEFFSVTN